MAYFNMKDTDQVVLVPEIIASMYKHLTDKKWKAKELFQCAVAEIKKTNDPRFMVMDETLKNCPNHDGFVRCLMTVLNAHENNGVFYTGSSAKECLARIEFGIKAYRIIFEENPSKKSGEEPDGYKVHSWNEFSVNSSSGGFDIVDFTLENMDEIKNFIRASKNIREAIEAMKARYDISRKDSFEIVGFVSAMMTLGRGEV